MEFIKEHLKLVFQELKLKYSFRKIIKIIGLPKQYFNNVIEEINLNKRCIFDNGPQFNIFPTNPHSIDDDVDKDNFATPREYRVVYNIEKQGISYIMINNKIDILVCDCCGNYTYAPYCDIPECIECKCSNYYYQTFLKRMI